MSFDDHVLHSDSPTKKPVIAIYACRGLNPRNLRLPSIVESRERYTTLPGIEKEKYVRNLSIACARNSQSECPVRDDM